MFDLTKYKQTALNIGEASSEDTMELLLFFSGVFIIVVLSPVLYLVSDTLLAAGAGVIFGVADLFMSQYLPERMQIEEQKENQENENKNQEEVEYNA